MYFLINKNNIFFSNFLCFLAVAFFSLSFPINEILLKSWDIFSLLVFRNIFALFFLFIIWVVIDKNKKISLKDWIKGILIGGIGFGLGTTLIVFSQLFSGPVIAALAAALMPISGFFLEYIFDNKKITFNFFISIVLVIIGGIIVTGIYSESLVFNFGIFLGIFASLFFAWGSRQTVISLDNVNVLVQTLVTSTGMLIFSLLVLVLSNFFFNNDLSFNRINFNDLGFVIFYSFFCLVVSQILWIKSVKLIGIGIASFHLNIAPFYVMLILIFMGYDWSWIKFLGALIVFSGIIISQKNNFKK